MWFIKFISVNYIFLFYRLKFESDLQAIDLELSEEKTSLEEKYLAEVGQAEEKAKKQKEDLQAKFRKITVCYFTGLDFFTN